MKDATTTQEPVSRNGASLVVVITLICWLLAAPSGSELALYGAAVIASLLFATLVPWRRTRKLMIEAAVMVAVTLSVIAAIPVLSDKSAIVVCSVWLAIVTIIAPISTVRRLRTATTVNAQVLWAVIAIYLYCGVAFSMVYGILAVVQDVPLFTLNGRPFDGTFQDHVYFSFVTLTTTGYGDIAPSSGAAQAVAIVEVLGGQLYLVVAVAAVVGLLLAKPNRSV